MFEIAGLSLLAFTLSYLGVIGLRRWAERRQILDIPGERSSHTRPTPRGGGVAIVIICLIGLLIAWLLNPTWSLSTIITYLCIATFIATISWLDDLYSLSNRVRLTAHSLAGILSVWGLGYWHSVYLPILGELDLSWLGVPVTFLWIVGLTNAYNFMDGIDGIAGGQGVVAGLGWSIWGLMSNDLLIASLGMLLAASCLGFLGHNWPPARIFMGDVGSAFLGYTFAILPIIAVQHDSRMALVGILVVWPFVFDTFFTFFRRLRDGENVFKAHRSHLYQRLVIAGFTHRFVSLLYISLSLMGVILSLIWTQNIISSSLLVSLAMLLLCVGLWSFVKYQERSKAMKQGC